MKMSLISIRISVFFTVFFLLICYLMPLVAKAQADEPDLASWLAEHPLISGTIRWQEANRVKTYPEWSSAQKANLFEMYYKVWNGKPLGLTDPPPNMFDLVDDEFARTGLSKNHAWSLFLAQVAYSLAVETGGWVPWSLTEYSQQELLELFDGSRMFRWHNNLGGYRIYFGVPAPPDFTFEFLNANRMIAQDRLHTIENLLNWCRLNMRHYLGRSSAQNMEDHWQYRGVAPISRVVSGTRRDSDGEFSHFTAGCWGTTTFLSAVLRVVNIPVKEVGAHGHAFPYFMSEGKYLSHGDDPYNQTMRSTPLIPIEELLIDETTYDAWFGPSVPSEVSNIGRTTKELAIKYLPHILLTNRCSDHKSGNSHENSYIYNNYLGLYRTHSLEELEAINFWDRMDTKIDNLGGCPISNTMVVFDPVAVSNNLLVVEVRDDNGQPIEGELVVFRTESSDEKGRTQFKITRKGTDADGRTRMRFGSNVPIEVLIGYGVVHLSFNGEVLYDNPINRSHIVFQGLKLKRSDNLLRFSVSDTAIAVGEPRQSATDVNGDGVVNIQDLVLVASSFGQTGENSMDVNGDGVINIQDLVLVAGAFGEGTAAAPTLQLSALEDLTAAEVQRLLTQAYQTAFTDPVYLRGVEVLEQLLALLLPKETVLLANYPNPFNPETWIPYQLAKPTEVALHIYSVDGALVRTLALGHQPTGMYHSKSRAAYWDGRNEQGERVASGIYFYTLSAGDFTATRKMLITK